MGLVCVDEVTNMSLPRLLNSRMLELRRQLVASSSSSNTTRDPPPLHLSRNLFGTVDLQHNLKFAQQEMNKIHQADSKRWNFDFLAEKPKDGDYKWQKVEEEEPVPHTYDNNNPALTCRSSSAITCLTTTHLTTSPTNNQITTNNNKGLKRLHNKSPQKVAKKLCTDYFTEVKHARQTDRSKLKVNSDLLNSAKYVNTKLTEILKMKPTNTK